ncbi:MAG: glycoside hydrolase family 16 protein, partial [Proteobacteria bacterium]
VPQWCGGFLVENPAVVKHKYGYFEYRARFRNQGRGMFPALWLLGSDGNTDPNNKGASEIDVMEMFGTPNPMKTTMHMLNTKREGYSVAVGKYTTDIKQYHTYGVDWQPDHVSYYLDGKFLYEVRGKDASFFDSTMNIHLNYAMDANWFPLQLKSDATTPNELFMDVDYVRVYDKLPF